MRFRMLLKCRTKISYVLMYFSLSLNLNQVLLLQHIIVLNSSSLGDRWITLRVHYTLTISFYYLPAILKTKQVMNVLGVIGCTLQRTELSLQYIYNYHSITNPSSGTISQVIQGGCLDIRGSGRIDPLSPGTDMLSSTVLTYRGFILYY